MAKKDKVWPKRTESGQKGQRLAKKDRVWLKRTEFGQKGQRLAKKDTVWPKRTESGQKGQRSAQPKEQRPEHQKGQLATLLTKLRAGTAKRKTKRSALSKMASGGHCQQNSGPALLKRKPKEVHCLKCQVMVTTKQTEAGNA